MKRILLILTVLIGLTAQAQQTFNPTIRLLNVAENPSAEMVLVVNSVTKNVEWVKRSEISPDLSGYYTISEVDALLEEYYTSTETDALFLGYYTSAEVDAFLEDYYTKTDVDSIITNVNDRIDSLELEVEQIDLNTVTSVDNVTSIKIRGSDIFTNNLETDFAQIADVNKAGFGLISMQSEMKIGLVAKDGTTLLDDVDVSWLSSGDLAITIDVTDPNNPELVFSQNGVEVARIPASTLLAGVARSANLSNYILQFKDGTGAVVYSVNLEPLFEDYFTKAEANARFATKTELNGKENAFNKNTAFNKNFGNSAGTVAEGNHTHSYASLTNKPTTLSGFGITDGVPNSRNITAGNGLTGGGNLTSNRTIALGAPSQITHTSTNSVTAESHTHALSSYIKNDLSKGAEAHSWGDFRDFGLGGLGIMDIGISEVGSFIRSTSTQEPYESYGVGINMSYGLPRRGSQIFIENIASQSNTTIKFRNYFDNVDYTREIWHDGNLPNPATETWVNDQGFIKSLSNYYTKNESLDQFVGLSGVQDIADTKTFLASPVVPNPTLDVHAVNKGWVEEVTRLNHARYQTDSQSLATSGFIEFNGTPDFTNDYITQRANKYEFEVSEGGFYEVTLSWRSAFNNLYYLEFEINGFSKIINVFTAGGSVFQYTYREYLDEGDLFRISSDDEILGAKCTLYIKKIK